MLFSNYYDMHSQAIGLACLGLLIFSTAFVAGSIFARCTKKREQGKETAVRKDVA